MMILFLVFKLNFDKLILKCGSSLTYTKKKDEILMINAL